MSQIQAKVAMAQGLHTRSDHSRRIFIEAPTQRMLKIFTARTSTEVVPQDPHESPLQGPVQNHGQRENFTRTSSRASHKDLYKILQRPLRP